MVSKFRYFFFLSDYFDVIVNIISINITEFRLFWSECCCGFVCTVLWIVHQFRVSMHSTIISFVWNIGHKKSIVERSKWWMLDTGVIVIFQLSPTKAFIHIGFVIELLKMSTHLEKKGGRINFYLEHTKNPNCNM